MQRSFLVVLLSLSCLSFFGGMKTTPLHFVNLVRSVEKKPYKSHTKSKGKKMKNKIKYKEAFYDCGMMHDCCKKNRLETNKRLQPLYQSKSAQTNAEQHSNRHNPIDVRRLLLSHCYGNIFYEFFLFIHFILVCLMFNLNTTFFRVSHSL